MTNEERMKDYLDGKFFFLTHEGRTECRDVPTGFEGRYTAHRNSPEDMREAGLKSVAKARLTKPEHEWTDNELMLLMYLRRQKASVLKIATQLNLSRWLVNKKCGEMGI